MDGWDDGPTGTVGVNAAAPTMRRGRNFVSGFNVPSSQPPIPISRPLPPANIVPPPARKANKHRKRHVPVGPAGLWFQSQRQQTEKSQSVVDGLSRHRTLGSDIDITLTQGSSLEDDAQPESHRRGNHAQRGLSSSAMLLFFSPAWTAAHCQLDLVTPSCPVYWSCAQKYAALKHHLPQPYILLADVYNGVADWNMKALKLLVQVTTVHSVTANDRLWTVTLQDETGSTITAWIQPALVHSEQQQTKFIRPGMVWLVSSCTIQLVVESDQSHNDDENEEDFQNERHFSNDNHDQCSGISRMILVSESNIEQTWSNTSADQVANEVYVSWLQARNTLTADLNKTIDDSNANVNGVSDAVLSQLNAVDRLLDRHVSDAGHGFDVDQFEMNDDEESVSIPTVVMPCRLPTCALQSLPINLSLQPTEPDTSRQYVAAIELPRARVNSTTCESVTPIVAGRLRHSLRTEQSENEMAIHQHMEHDTVTRTLHPPTKEVGDSLCSGFSETATASQIKRGLQLDTVALPWTSSVYPRETKAASLIEPVPVPHSNLARSTTKCSVKTVNLAQFAATKEQTPLETFPLHPHRSNQKASGKTSREPLRANDDKSRRLSTQHEEERVLAVQKKQKTFANQSSNLFCATHTDILDLFDEDGDNEQDLVQRAVPNLDKASDKDGTLVSTVDENSANPYLKMSQKMVNAVTSTSVHAASVSTGSLFKTSVLAGLDMDAMFGDDD